MGLSIGKRIAKKMGGHITVESESSRGSTFRLSVRLGRVHSTRRSGSGALTLEGMPILLLQKPGPNREALVDQFKSWGAKVWTAADPLEALRLASSAVAGMLVIKLDDVKFEFVEKMRRQPGLKKSLLVLMATTGQRGDGARCQSLGARAYLSGHLEPKLLKKALLLSQGNTYSLVTRHTLRELNNANRELVTTS